MEIKEGDRIEVFDIRSGHILAAIKGKIVKIEHDDFFKGTTILLNTGYEIFVED